MYKTITTSLVNASRVVERLVEQYGPEQVCQVERLSEHIFRARLKSGGAVLAIVRRNGALHTHELEEVC